MTKCQSSRIISASLLCYFLVIIVMIVSASPSGGKVRNLKIVNDTTDTKSSGEDEAHPRHGKINVNRITTKISGNGKCGYEVRIQ